jgi:hypothetical protein
MELPAGSKSIRASSDAIVLQRRFVDGGLRMKVGGVDGIFEAIAARLDRFSRSAIVRIDVEWTARFAKPSCDPGASG